MSYLIRVYQGKAHQIAHYVHEVNGVTGALCSQTPKPAVGDQSRNGQWTLLETLPPKVKLCQVCQKRKNKLDNPLPERVERELEMMAQWDPQAAAIQREKMLDVYRNKYKNRK